MTSEASRITTILCNVALCYNTHEHKGTNHIELEVFGKLLRCESPVKLYPALHQSGILPFTWTHH